jgi:hypothetical protein
LSSTVNLFLTSDGTILALSFLEYKLFYAPDYSSFIMDSFFYRLAGRSEPICSKLLLKFLVLKFSPVDGVF